MTVCRQLCLSQLYHNIRSTRHHALMQEYELNNAPIEQGEERPFSALPFLVHLHPSFLSDLRGHRRSTLGVAAWPHLYLGSKERMR